MRLWTNMIATACLCLTADWPESLCLWLIRKSKYAQSAHKLIHTSTNFFTKASACSQTRALAALLQFKDVLMLQHVVTVHRDVITASRRLCSMSGSHSGKLSVLYFSHHIKTNLPADGQKTKWTGQRRSDWVMKHNWVEQRKFGCGVKHSVAGIWDNNL